MKDPVVPETEFDGNTYGVIVARFQVPKLHKGHKHLIDTVMSRHEKVVIVLGLSHISCSQENPLDFSARKQMIEEDYGDNVIIKYIKNCKTNKEWSDNLDKLLVGLPELNPTITLYGSRDSFARHYMGKYPVVNVEQKGFYSGKQIRKDIAKGSQDKNESWRTGCVHVLQNQWPRNEQCVDVAIFNEARTEILLGRKEDETLFQLIGGFVENDTFEVAAIKEAKEEAGNDLELSFPKPLRSFRVNDWRYRGEATKILTILYETTVLWGRPEAGDDIVEVKWFPFDGNLVNEVTNSHQQMIKFLLKK